MGRRHSDPVWLPEEPFVPKHSSASMKILLLVWAYGQKVYPKEHQRAPRLPKGTTAPPWKAASMLCSGHPRTGDTLTLSWLPLLTCGGAEVPFCAQQRWGEAPTTAPSLLLAAQSTLQNLQCVSSPGSPVQGDSPMEMGSCWHGGELRGRSTGRDAKSQAFSLNEVSLGLEAKIPF